jgi:TonB family protein
VDLCPARLQDQARTRRIHTAVALLVAVGGHALALLAFNSPGTTRHQIASSTTVEQAVPLDFTVPPEEPPPTAVAETAPEARTQDTQDGPTAASLPEPMSSVGVADITVVIRPSIPVKASTDAARWSVPASQLRPSAAPSLARVFKLGELDRRPVLVSSVEPVFPGELSTSSVQGVVVVHFIVNAHGAVESAEVVSAPHPLLGTAVTNALARWQFRAGMKNGRAVSTEMEQPVRFNLAGT